MDVRRTVNPSSHPIAHAYTYTLSLRQVSCTGTSYTQGGKTFKECGSYSICDTSKVYTGPITKEQCMTYCAQNSDGDGALVNCVAVAHHSNGCIFVQAASADAGTYVPPGSMEASFPSF
jgi:hypothetical protein